MGLREVVAGLATRRVHALVLEVPGTFAVRVALEDELARRGWVQAASPADADLLVTTGVPGEQLAAAEEVCWAQLPDPRAQVRLSGVESVAPRLDDALARLRDDEAVRRAATGRANGPSPAPPGQDDGDQDEMDHGEMAPEGIPLAGGDDDRDGLEMDVLHVPLGPVLAHWPPGLVLRTVLHGDVVGAAEAEWWDGGREALVDRPDAARLLDAAAGCLELAGARHLGTRARALRDRVLQGADVSADAEDLARRVARDRVLRWSLRGLGGAGSADGGRPDARDRLLHLLRLSPAPPDDTPLVDLVAGQDLSGTRLLVAASSPWAARLNPTPEEAAS